MKYKLKFPHIIVIILFAFNGFSQTVTIQNLEYTNNGQSTISAPNCGNIDLDRSTSTSINLGVLLSKSNNQAIGTCDLIVYTQKSSGNVAIKRSSTQIPEAYWNHPSSGNDTYLTTPPSFSINSNEFNISGGTLFVVLKSIISGDTYQSCSYTITKTPTPSFTLSPTSLSLDCGDTSSRTFTVTPTNIPNGVTPTYQWSNNGWSLVSSTTNSRTLQPISGNFLPSTVSVTPYVNGVAYPTKTCTISRSAFVSSASITGNNGLCTTAASTYTVIGLQNGESVTWSVSNSSIATLGNTSGNTTTLTKVGTGSITLTATILNSCVKL